MHRPARLALTLLCCAGPGWARNADHGFDPPVADLKTAVPLPGNPNGPGEVRCLVYPDVTVKELDLREMGATAISVTPLRPNQVRRPCGKQDDPGEVVLKNGGGYTVVGVVSGYLQTAYVDGQDGTTIRIYDTRTGRELYSDYAASLVATRVGVKDQVLTLAYTRVVPGPCSILAAGQACWTRMAAKLPPAIASLPPPLDSCRTNYAKGAGGLPGPIDAADPSFIRYDVVMTLDHSGRATVVSRGAPSCWPLS